jgi:protocatechuate 3,4-dioxygenase beta subunit
MTDLAELLKGRARRLSVLAGVLLALGGAARVASTPLAVGGHQVVVTVADLETRVPIVSASVHLFPIESRMDAAGNQIDIVLSDAAALAEGRTNSRELRTDRDGRIVFDDVQPGRYGIAASHPRYLKGQFTEAGVAEPSRLLDLDAAPADVAVAIRLARPLVVTGRVEDEDHDAVAGVTVHALRVETVGGARRLVDRGTAQTDDRGVYRFDRLVPGDYVVALPATTLSAPAGVNGADVSATAGAAIEHSGGVLPPSGAEGQSPPTIWWRGPAGRVDRDVVEVYASQFVPVSSPIGSTPMRVEAALAVPEVNFTLEPTRAVTVSGVVHGPDGPEAYRGLRLVSFDAAMLASDGGFEAAQTISDAQGQFAFRGVPPGSYLVKMLVDSRAWRPGAGSLDGAVALTVVGRSVIPTYADVPEPVQWATVPVVVGREDVSHLDVMTQRGARVVGQVRVTARGENDEGRLRAETAVSLALADAVQPRPGAPAEVDANGSFMSDELPPGRYLVAVRLPSTTLRVGAIVADGRDAMCRAIEVGSTAPTVSVTLTDQDTTAAGQVAMPAAAGAAASGAGVLVALFPADVDSWIASGMPITQCARAVVSTDGRVSFANLAPGEYSLAVDASATPLDWSDLDRVRQLARKAVRVTLRPGANQLPIRSPESN